MANREPAFRLINLVQPGYRFLVEPKVIETDATSVVYEENLLTIRSKGVHSTRASVDKTLAAAKNLVGDNRGPLLFDAREWPGGDPEGWVSVVSTIGDVFTAAAMVVDPKKMDDIGPFPSAIDRLVIPFQVFVDVASALSFLEPYRSSDDSSG